MNFDIKKKNKRILEPFLQFGSNSIYNPITDLTIKEGDQLFTPLLALFNEDDPELPGDVNALLDEAKWTIDESTEILSRHHLKVVQIEGNSHCNQRCYFCPVSLHPKPIHTMALDFYEDIIEQISIYRSTIQAVFMINYNEPTVDKFFIERIRILKKFDLPICINTNGTGLNKKKIDEIVKLGGLRYLSINLSTLDPDQYARDRSGKQLDKLRENVNYLKSIPIAEEMAIAVLGTNDDRHRQNYEQIREAYGDGYFEVKYFEIMDRAGALNVGQTMETPIQHLRGCENLGSRPVQHLTINAHGECVICCEDYYEKYKVGDLKHQSVEEILTGEKMRQIRAMLYGMQQAPEDFICRKCVFALTCPKRD